MKKILISAMLVMAAAMAPGVAAAQSTPQDGKTADYMVDLDTKYATDLLKPGTDSPDIALTTADGRPFRLSDMRGRYVVLDFWASWCPDCRRDAPRIVKMYDAFKGKGVEFVGVSFDMKAEVWKNGIEKLGLKYTQVSDLKNMRSSEVAQAYHIKWIPSVYVIDPQGKVALATVMSDKADAFLRSVYPDCAE